MIDDSDRRDEALVKTLRVFAVGIAVAMVVAGSRGAWWIGVTVFILLLPVMWAVEYWLLDMSPHYPPDSS